MASGKMLSESELIGDAGIALIHRRVNAMGHAWRQLGLDAGIDGSIELRDPSTGEVSNRHILVQSKASKRPFPGETVDRFHFICDERDLEYWLKSDQPVILVCSHPDADAWWVHVQSYFADAARRADRRVDFDKPTMSFEGDITDRLLAVADPEGRAHTPTPMFKQEVLESNLLLTRPPASYFSYATTASDAREVYEAQRIENLGLRHDFVLKAGRLLTFRSVDETGLGVTVRGEPTAHALSHLVSGGTGDDERLAVQLLNRALRDDLSDECDFTRGRNLLYVRATDDLSARKWNTGGSNWRSMFKGYPKKNDPSKVSYYRHAALSWQFMSVDSEWYCALTPDYYFTHDGHRESFFAADLLKKIKMIDRHQAVRQETRMWASIVRGEVTLLKQPRPRILDFGDIAAFSIDRGIDDAAWKQAPPADPVLLAAPENALFEVCP